VVLLVQPNTCVTHRGPGGDLQQPLPDLVETVHRQRDKITKMSEELEILQKTVDPMKETIENINVKVMDFNIYDLFKSGGEGGGSMDAAVLLVQNLDNKITQKLTFVDKKIKILEEDNFKNKNEIANLKSVNDGVNRSLQNLKEDADKMNQRNNLLIKEIQSIDEKSEEKIQENYNKIMTIIDDNIKEIKEFLAQREENLVVKTTDNEEKSDMTKTKMMATGQVGLNENDMKKFKEMSKKINELDKNFKFFTANVNIDFIRSELTRLSESLNEKTTVSELHELREFANSSSGNALISLKLIHLN
jgi:hypothetical protein